MDYCYACSPPCKGGVAVPSRKRIRSEMARPGWSLTHHVSNAFRNVTCERPPRLRHFGGFASFLNGASTPPLRGGEHPDPLLLLQYQIQIRIDSTSKLRRHEGRRTVFPDDRRALDGMAMAQRFAIVDGCFNPLPVDPHGPAFHRLRLPPLLRRFTKFRFWSASRKRCAYIHQFNRAIGVRIPIPPFMYRVKLFDKVPDQRNCELVRLATIAQVDEVRGLNFALSETFRLQFRHPKPVQP